MIQPASALRVSKKASKDEVSVGDLIGYTVTVENVETGTVNNFVVDDILPPGFRYVAGTSRIYKAVDGKMVKYEVEPEIIGNMMRFSNNRIENFKLLSQEKLEITYILRVGTAVVPGDYENIAQAKQLNRPKDKWSNIAKETVQVKLDQLFDTTSIIGKVFHDRDKDGWQDDATAENITIKIIEGQSNYVLNDDRKKSYNDKISEGNDVYIQTFIKENEGEWAMEFKLLERTGVGAIDGRYGENMPVNVTYIRREIKNPEIISKLIVTTKAGTKLFLNDNLEEKVIADHIGEKKAGETAEDIRVGRKIIEANRKYYEEIQIYNFGIYEEGLRDIKISTIRGEIINTDNEGRYHVKDIEISEVTGENFILKVDPNSLPRNAEFTTPNSMIKRLNKTIEKYNFGVYFN